MRMPDGNTAALNAHEAAEAQADRTWAALAPQAREDVRERWWKRLNMDDVIDALCRLTASDEADFLQACRRYSHDDAGSLLTTALDHAADAYLDTERGQQEIADRVWAIDQEERDT